MNRKTLLGSIAILIVLFLNYSCSDNHSDQKSEPSLTPKTKKLLLIGIDGCRGDALMSSNTPNVKSLLNNSVYSFDALTNSPTWSGNGWSTMLTGVSSSKHGVTDNSFSTPNFALYPSFLKRLETQNPALNTVSIAFWKPINNYIIDGIDVEKTPATDLEVKNEAVNTLKNNNPDVLFLHFDDVDHAGHAYGFSGSIPEYKAAIETTDVYIGEILNTLKSRSTYANEDWLIIVSTDHGGVGKSHGGSSYQERNIFTVFHNKDFPTQQADPETSITGSFVNFNSNKIYASTTNPLYNFGTSDFTVECKVKTSGFSSDPAIVSNKKWASGSNPGFVIAGDGASWRANIGTGSSRMDLKGSYPINDGKWHHLVMVVDRTARSFKIYQDGALANQAAISSDFGSLSSGLPLAIGQDGTLAYGRTINGNIAEVRIWNKALPESSILNNMCTAVTTSHPDYSSLIGYWKGDTGSGNIFTDSSPSNISMSLSNNPTWTSGTDPLKCGKAITGEVPKMTDIAYSSLKWFGLDIPFGWSLEGNSLLPTGK
ncbi:alkaline phosphatase family protein [Flavobacterium sp. N502536]|uniref:alkaline phosphatase family protein n=1 Tax=Flavobacterium sp. N502536 TaxID=2986837 RepID=UPI0022238DF8|nr:alkaline phosphatase family protein [Flavobacterium sp. N502536]